MGDIIRLRKNPHDEVQDLLPWFVNGSLAPDEIARVEAHRNSCASCRSDLSSERQLASAVAGLSLDCASAWERMRELVANRSVGRRSLLRRRVSIGWAVAAPLAAAAALALVFVDVAPRQVLEPQYHALGATGTIKQPNLIVQFQPSARVTDMDRLLQLSDARLVDGPTVTGAYLLRVDQAKRDRALEKLRKNQAIALAEPIDAPPGE